MSDPVRISGPATPSDEATPAARIAKGILDAEARGMTWLLGKRGAPIVELDHRGRVLPGQAAGDGNPACPVQTLRQRLAEIGTTPVGGTGAAFAKFLDDDIARWAKVVHAAKITIE